MLDHRIRPALARGARSAGRTGQGPALVVAPQPLLAATPGELAQVREERRSELAFLYSTPAYRRQLEEFGLGEVGEALSETARRKDWTALAAHMSDEVIGTLVPQGTYDQMSSILADWYAGRCSGIVLKAPDSTGGDHRYRQLISECRNIPATATS